MKETGIFFLYLFGCLILAALLTVPLAHAELLDYPPHRVMGRLAQIFILLGLWPFLRWRGLTTRPALGYLVAARPLWRAILAGWLGGVLILLALVAALLALHVRVPDPDAAMAWPELAAIALRALLAGLLIATLEETFFRGALFSGIRRQRGLLEAAGWSAGLYAIIHFMKPGRLPAETPLDWPGALRMVTQVFADALQWSHLDSLAALFMAGLFLALIRERTGHIGWCIGLHAGWVFVIQVTRDLTDNHDQAALAFLAGNYDGVIGWLAAVWIGLLALRVHTGLRRATPP